MSLRRYILIAACAVGLAVVVGVVAQRRDEAEQQAKLAAAQQQRTPAAATVGSSAYPSPASAPGADSTAAKPVVIAVVKPWIEIARMPQYVKASAAEREAIRDLYWRLCVEDEIPGLQRELAYRRFVRAWGIAEYGASDARTRTTSVSYLREQPAAPSPVSEGTMRRTCET